MSSPPEVPEKINLTKQGLERVQSKKQLEEDTVDEQHLLSLKLRNQQIQIAVRGEEQKQYLQKDYAEWVKKIVSLWLCFVASVLIAVAGSEYWPHPIKLPSSVLVALLVSNVVPLSAILIKGLFTKK